MEIQPINEILVSDVTAHVFKKNNLWQVLVTVFFQTFKEKNININKVIHVTCILDGKYSKDIKLTNLIIRNNHANTTVILNIPLVSMFYQYNIFN